jgi:hypothetical protein
MKITVTVDIGTEGDKCWTCQFLIFGSRFCDLFRTMLVRSKEGPCRRCLQCLWAEKENKNG